MRRSPINAKMAFSASGLRLLIKGLLRIAFRVYFRSIHVQGIERFPARGAVLLVANHPNSLLDPAVLVTLLPRPVHFAAKHTLFKGPLRAILEAFGAIPLVRAQDDPQAMGRNAGAFKRFEALLLDGRVTAIFPEGLTQDDPHLAPVKAGAARIALQAEAAADFNLGLTIIPVGLQFEPRRRFRGDAFVRFGEPFMIADLADRYAEDQRQATRELTDRISTSIKGVAYHVDSADRVPFVERLVDVYFQRARRTGITGVRGRGVRGELKQKMAACFNHYAEADPEAVAEVERQLKRYERLRDMAGLDRRLLEEPFLPGPLAPVQATAEALLDGMFAFPLTRILGRQALPAMGFVQMYADARGRDDRPFDFLQMLDVDEDRGRAVAASEAVLLQTLDRSGFTFLQ